MNHPFKNHKGLGDTVAAVTQATGIRSIVEKGAKAFNKPCGCEGRRKTLNELFPYGKREENKICPEGIAWAKRTFDRYPSAYANMAASKYCKDPNYAKNSKRKEKMKVKAPKGYHWMSSGKGAPKLMKHKGKFVPHKGASLSFNFSIQKLHNK